MTVKIKIVKEHLPKMSIIGDSWQLVSIVRQHLAVKRDRRQQRQIEKREREICGMRRIEAQFIRGI